MQSVEPVVLEGRTVRLEPLSEAHAADLREVATPETFRYFVTLQPFEPTAAGMADFVRRTLEVPRMLPFAVILRATGKAIGITTYMDIRPEHGGLEIGFTWYGEAFRGTRVNPECKLLLLSHAFEVLGCDRVQLKTDGRNLHSQGAIRKLGATYEGTLRRFMRMPDGYMRDTVMFSILSDEWPRVKKGLLERLEEG